MEIRNLPAFIAPEEVDRLHDLVANSVVLNDGSFDPRGHFWVRRNDRHHRSRAVALWSDQLIQARPQQILSTDPMGFIKVEDPEQNGVTVDRIYPWKLRHVYESCVGLERQVGESGYVLPPNGGRIGLGRYSYSRRKIENMLLKAEYYGKKPSYTNDDFPYMVQVDRSLAGDTVFLYGFVNRLQSRPNGEDPIISDYVVVSQKGELIPRVLRPLFSSRYWWDRR